MNIFRALFHDDHGFIISAELVVISTLLVVGLVTGLQYIQASVVGEMRDVGSAIGSLNQSYSYTGSHGCCHRNGGYRSWTPGSCFADTAEETHVPVDFVCLDQNASYQNVALAGPETSNDETTGETACDAPCESPHCDPCRDSCCNSCGHPCGCHCRHACGSPCGKRCGHRCDDSCHDHCGNRCGHPCGESDCTACGHRCGSGCGHSCDNCCDAPCSAVGRPARIYGSSQGGCCSQSAEYETLDGGPYPSLPPLRRCPVNDDPCPGCSGEAALPECGPQLYPTLLSDCRPCSPTDVQIVW